MKSTASKVKQDFATNSFLTLQQTFFDFATNSFKTLKQTVFQHVFWIISLYLSVFHCVAPNSFCNQSRHTP